MTTSLAADALLSVIGSASDAPSMAALWAELNTLNRPEHPDAEERRYHDWVLVRRKGLELGFVDSEYEAASARFRWGHGDMVLSQLYFYSGHDDIQRYAGTLPFGLQWGDDRSIARRRLAAFEDSRHSHLTDAWDVPGYRLTATYADDTGGLSRVVCRRLPEPIPSGHAAVVPPLLSLIGAFGESVASQTFAGLWDPVLWTSDQLTQAREEDAVDLNAACGVTIGVVGEGRDAMLRSVTLHRNRDQDGSGWNGALPCGLDFEDSPETLFKKVGSHPVQHADSALTGHAVWHSESFTMHVLYSNVDNRLIRVKLMAPGTWRCVADE